MARHRPTAFLTRLIFTTAFVLALAAAALPASGAGSARSFRWDRINVAIDVQPDGSAVITEEQQITFQGPYSFVNRVIPLQRLEDITDIVVGDEQGWYSQGVDPTYRPTAVAGYIPKGQPGRFIVERSGGEVRITWYFVAINETRTFKVRYRVTGLVRGHSDADEIWWTAVGPDRGAEVLQAAATIRLPQRVSSGKLVASAYENENRVRDGALVNDFGATYEYRRPIPEDESWTVRLFFPRGIVAAVPPILFRRYAAPLLISLVLTAAAAVRFVRTANAGRGHPQGAADDGSHPPADVPPGLVAYLFNPFGSLAGAATMFDLARRGYITVTRTESERQSGRTRALYTIEDAGGDRSALLEYERSLLEALLARSPLTGPQLQQTLARIDQHRELSAAADARGWFEAEQRARNSSMFAGALMVAAACVALTTWAALRGPEWAGPVALIAGTLACVLELIRPLLILTRRTEAGLAEQRRWAGFFRQLRRPEAVLARGPELAVQWLPYAIAAGAARDWQRALRNCSVPAPAWFRSEGTAGPAGEIVLADFVRDMLWVGTYGGVSGGGIGGASGGGGGTAG